MTNHLPIGRRRLAPAAHRRRTSLPAPGQGSGPPSIASRRPNYFATLRIPFRSGRDFNDRDTENAPPVMIVNETLARREFAHENPLGKRIALGDGAGLRSG